MSPLGELYRRELGRMARRWPALSRGQVDRLVALSLARAFVDLTATELVGAVAEDSPCRDGRTDAREADEIGRVVRAALDIAASERGLNGG